MSIAEPLAPALQDLINRHLNEVERVLLASGVKTGERRRIIDDLELQIHEMLARDAGPHPTEADVRAVLARLDPPEAYADAASGDERSLWGAEAASESNARSPLRRLRSDRVLAGVCAGLARFFDVNAWNVRLIFVLFSTSGSVLAYGALWLIVPLDANDRHSGNRNKLEAAHSFPIAFSIAWLFAWLSIIFFITRVVPRFQDIFGQLGGELPMVTRVLVGMSDILLHRFFLFGIMIAGFLYGAPVALYMVLPKRFRPALVVVCGLSVAALVYALYAPLFQIPKLIK